MLFNKACWSKHEIGFCSMTFSFNLSPLSLLYFCCSLSVFGYLLLLRILDGARLCSWFEYQQMSPEVFIMYLFNSWFEWRIVCSLSRLGGYWRSWIFWKNDLELRTIMLNCLRMAIIVELLNYSSKCHNCFSTQETTYKDSYCET